MTAPAPELVVWAAARTVRQHTEPASEDRATGRCQQCPPEGPCPMLDWAHQVTMAAGRG